MIATATREKIDALFSQFSQPGSPGCALGIMQDGEMVYQQGYGLADLERNVAITPSTRFYIASMAKQFTGMAIAMLATASQLDLDADIRSILPYVPDFGHTITPRHLLHHTSGLRSDIFLLIASGWRIEDVIRQEDIVDFVKAQRELDFIPGEEFSYCGTGYSLLAEIVAAVSGQSFASFCHERMFAPLEMENTRFEEDPLALIPHRASTYFGTGEEAYKKAVLTIGILGGTGLYSTVEDLAKWDADLATGSVVGRQALDLVMTPATLNSGDTIPYGFGLIVDEHRGRPTLHHGGDSAGVHCYFLRFPEEPLTVVLLGNASTVKASALVYQVADLLLDPHQASEESAAPESTSVEADLPADVVAARAGRYYDARTGAFIDLLFQDDILSVHGYELVPASANEYFLRQHPSIVMVFSESADGGVEASVDFGTGSATYRQVDSIDPTPDKLAAYVGSYRSPELDVIWRIELDGDRLVAHRFRQGTSSLIPICEDTFADPWAGEILHGDAQWVISFEREDGAISGLRLTAAGARGRNLWFGKVESAGIEQPSPSVDHDLAERSCFEGDPYHSTT